MSAIDAYLEQNARVAAGFVGEPLSAAPERRIAIVACMDARLEASSLIGLRRGEAHVIRNAGGIATDDVIRSLVISQHLLGTREVMLIQHTDCGLQRFTDDEIARKLEAEVGARPPFPFRTFSDVDASVRDSIERLAACPFLVHRNAIRGFVYEVKTGRLREVEPDSGLRRQPR